MSHQNPNQVASKIVSIYLVDALLILQNVCNKVIYFCSLRSFDSEPTDGWLAVDSTANIYCCIAVDLPTDLDYTCEIVNI